MPNTIYTYNKYKKTYNKKKKKIKVDIHIFVVMKITR